MIKSASFEAGVADAMEKAAAGFGTSALEYAKSVPGRVGRGAKWSKAIVTNPREAWETGKKLKETEGGRAALKQVGGDIAHTGAAAATVPVAGLTAYQVLKKKEREKKAGYGGAALGGAAGGALISGAGGALSGAGIGAVAGKKGEKKKRAKEDAVAGAKLFGSIGAGTGMLSGIGAEKLKRLAEAAAKAK